MNDYHQMLLRRLSLLILNLNEIFEIMNKIDSNPCVCIDIFTKFMISEVKEKDEKIKLRKINPCEGLGLVIGTSTLLSTPYFFAECSFLMGGFLAVAGLFVDVISIKHISNRHLSIKSIEKEISPLIELLKKIETIEKTHHLLKNNIKEPDLLAIQPFNVFTYDDICNKIFNLLNRQEVFNISLISKRFYVISCNLIIWKELLPDQEFIKNNNDSNSDNKLLLLKYKEEETKQKQNKLIDKRVEYIKKWIS